MAKGTKNRHAGTLQRRKQIDRAITYDMAMQVFLGLMTIELNEDFGFGKERLTRCARGFGELMDEYNAIVVKDGVDRANKWLKRRNDAIMREVDDGT